MKVSRLMLCVAVALGLGANTNAAIVITTNMGGADTEVREFEINASELEPDAVPTAQRGAANELATRAIDDGVEANNSDRSSVMYMKFNITGLPNHSSDPGFWADKQVSFRGTVRNTNINDSRLALPNTQSPTVRVNFDIRGLEPGHVYADDPGGSTTMTDRSGNSFQSPQYKYDWAEGIGTGGNNQTSGITYLSAPGITPFCTQYGACGEAYGDSDPNNIFKTLGQYDDFNSDARSLGNWTWPIPKNFFGGQANRYPVGLPLEYTDANGNLKQLIFDAQDAGRSSVTLMLNLAIDARTTTGGNPTPSSSMINFNYLFNPKEMTTLSDDNNWDPDGAGAGLPTGSPYSCNGTTATGMANCPGHTLGSNANGEFSPALVIRVPEPTSMILLALGAAVCGTVRRRK
ncbi:MAG: PEP-CTERM sorting domain-containing protein [Pirellulales bacterium]